MKKKQKVVRIHPRKKPNLAMPVCPYCGRDAVMRPAEYVYGDDTIIAGSMLYVCSGYPDYKYSFNYFFSFHVFFS